MSRIKLYLDEDAMRRAMVVALRSRNADVVTVADAGMVNRDDADQLVTAALAGRVLYTFNVGDYCALHQNWVQHSRTHAGIIVGRQKRFAPGEELRYLLRLMGNLSAEDMRDRLEFLSSWA